MSAPDGFGFDDRLTVHVKLSTDSDSVEAAGGQIERFELQLSPYGFTGEVGFWIDEDQAKGGKRRDSLKGWFGDTGLMEVEIEIGPGRLGYAAPENPQHLTLSGIVLERSLREQAFDVLDDAAILRRHYVVTFADPARVLWTQHFPYALYTETTIQEMLDDQRGGRVAIDYQWDPASEQRPLLFIGLDGVGCDASFYDFAFWLFEGYGARFTHDYGSGGYALKRDKEPLESPPVLPPESVARLERIYPEIPRCATRTRNSYTGSGRTEERKPEFSEDGVFRDTLLRTPIEDEAVAVVDREATRVRASAGLLHVQVASFPDDPFAPGSGCRFDAKNRWGAKGGIEGTEWRVREVSLSGVAIDGAGESNSDLEANDFHCEMKLVLEDADEPTDALPYFVAPTYPHPVEGMIVSEEGEDDDETFQTFEDSGTSQLRYRVKVPLFDDQIVHAPFDPCFSSGHFYTPAYRDERVLLSFGFDRVEIYRFLDWRAGIREQSDQLNRIQMGKTPENRSSISHHYDGDDPVLTLERLHDNDTATIELKEGALRIEVREQSA